MVEKFNVFGRPEVILLLKSSLKGLHFVTKIVVCNMFIDLHNLGDIVCGREILIVVIIAKHLFTPLWVLFGVIGRIFTVIFGMVSLYL